VKRVALNLNRRHLTATQRREVVRRLLTLDRTFPVKRLAREPEESGANPCPARSGPSRN
jgi:hypothetical protein